MRTFFDDGDFSPAAQNDKNQACHNETFSCHTEQSEVSQIQNRDISLSMKAQYDKEYNTNSPSCHTELLLESEVSINSKRALNSVDFFAAAMPCNPLGRSFHSK